ncbi:MAG: choice-of-anchor J domain-containing protein [Flavobacteriia bacterium]|nr:choice-of-anchor J domain-containing protein [Flavobacteriia bacterium]
METSPEFVAIRQQIEEQFQIYLQNPILNKATYNIPVVVHVLHLGEAIGTGTNISEVQIQSAIDNINDIYTNQGVDIQFCLAQREPDGDPSTGINRVLATGVTDYTSKGLCNGGTGSGGSDNEDAAKALSNWDNTKYYNIWIVSEINNNGGGSGTQGFAYYPGAPNGTDGAVMLYNAFGYDPGTGNSANFNLKDYTDGNTTFVHEMGHALNLKHTFEGDGTGSTCPTGNQCGDGVGDCCGDTPPHKRSSSDCVVGTNSCDGGSSTELFIHNYMDYSSETCQNDFTANQITRMEAVMVGTRASLTTSDGCTPANNNYDAAITTIVEPVSSYCQTTFSPKVTLRNFGLQTLTSVTINYNIDGGSNESFSWTGSLTTGSTENVTLDPVTTTVGAHTFTASTSSPNGNSDEYTANDDESLSFTITSSSSLPFTEGFEGAFPPANWTRTSEDASPFVTWSSTGKKQWDQRVTAGNGVSTLSAGMNNFDYNVNVGTKDELVSPSVSLSGTVAPKLTFKVAHKNWTSYNDVLKVFISDDCGTTYSEEYNKSGSTLSTNGTSTSDFIPSVAGDWRTETIDLSSYANKVVTVKFETTNAYGNNIYIDDINIFDDCTTSISGTSPSSRCGTGTVTLGATASAGNVKWYDQSSGGTLLHTGTSYTTPSIGITTSYWVEASYGSCTSTRSEVVATVNDCSTTLTGLSCGKNLYSMSEALYCDAVTDATNYRYEIRKLSDNSFVAEAVRGSNSNMFRLSWLTANPAQYGTTYKIRVAAYVYGTWQDYGTVCNVVTPSTTKLNVSSCNVSITSMSQALYCDPVTNATNYRYEVRKLSDNSLIAEAVRGSNSTMFRLSWLTANPAQFNTTYKIRVAPYVNGAWSDYGIMCTITTPSAMPLYDDNYYSLINQKELDVYPNPNDGTFTINTSSEGTYYIINEVGQKVQEINISPENGYQYKVEGLKQGVYFIIGVIENEVMTQKVVVQ